MLREYLGPDDVRLLTVEKVVGYVAWLGQRKPKRATPTGRGDSPKTISRRLASASAFCDWLVKRGDLRMNPFRGMPRPRRSKRLPRGIPVAWSDATWTLAGLASMDRVILGLMRYCGMRISDIFGLDIGDVDLQAGVVVIRSGKGDKDRAIPIDAELEAVLHDYLGSLGKVDLDRALLVGRRGNRISAKVIYRRLRKVTKAAGVPAFTPHPARHTFATEAAKAGMPLPVLQAILGHEDAGTTQLYFLQPS